MANVIINDTSLTNIADSIRSKAKTETTYLPSEMSAVIDDLKTLDEIDGIIESYKANSDTISANSFIEFVENYKVSQQLSTTTYTGYYCSACAIDDNKVLVTHSDNSSTGNYYLWGMVCTIGEDGTITKGTDTQLTTTTYSNRWHTVVALEKNKVFIAYGAGASNPYAYGLVCTIRGTIITKGTEQQLTTQSYSGHNCSFPVVVLSPTSVVVFNTGHSSYYCYAIACTVSGTTITTGTNTEVMASQPYEGWYMDAIKVRNNTILAVCDYGYASYGYSYARAMTVNGTTITLGTQATIATNSYESYEISLQKIDDNNVAYIFCGNSFRGLMYRKLTVANDLTVTTGDKLMLSGYYTINQTTPTDVGYGLTTAKYKNKIYVFHPYQGGSNTYQLGLTVISDLDRDKPSVRIKLLDSTAASYMSYNPQPGTYHRACALENGNIFCAHSYKSGSYFLYGSVVNLSKVQKAKDHIDGVALEDITTSKAGKVKLLK